METYHRVEATYARWDANYYDDDLEGEGCSRFHPPDLPRPAELVPLSQFGTEEDHLEHAQRRYSSVAHHAAWHKLLTELQGADRREAVRLVAVSQPQAGAFLNAVPRYKSFRVPTWALRQQVQRRLGLPLLSAAAAADGARRSRHGLVYDALGDVATNDGDAGHATRHYQVAVSIYDALRRVYGGCVQREPANYAGYSDHRPDIALLQEGSLTVFDLKVFDPIGSLPGKTMERGAYVAFGNTADACRDVVLGRRGRGRRGDRAYNRRTAEGYVQPQRGDYARALEAGVTVVPLLVETFGGFGPGLVDALQRATDCRQNALAHSEYDEATWATRKYSPFVAQRISVAVQLAAAQEIAEALNLSVAGDPRAP